MRWDQRCKAFNAHKGAEKNHCFLSTADTHPTTPLCSEQKQACSGKRCTLALPGPAGHVPGGGHVLGWQAAMDLREKRPTVSFSPTPFATSLSPQAIVSDLEKRGRGEGKFELATMHRRTPAQEGWTWLRSRPPARGPRQSATFATSRTDDSKIGQIRGKGGCHT